MNLTRAKKFYESGKPATGIDIPPYDSVKSITVDTGIYLAKVASKAIVNGLIIAGIGMVIKNSKIGKAASAESVVSGVRMVADGLNRE